MARILRIITLAGMEAVIVGLPLLVLTSIDPGWIWLFGLLSCGRIADAVALRAPQYIERVVLALSGIVAMIAGIASALAVSFGAAAAMLLPGSEQFATAYLVGLIALYLFWRGSRLAIADSTTISTFFGRGAGVLLFALLLRPVFRPGVELPLALLALQILCFVGMGLLALALAHADDEGIGSRGLNWRWLAILAAAIGAVVLLGVVAAGVLGGNDMLALAQGLLQLILLPFALVGGVLAWIFITLFAGPLSALLRMLLAAFPQLPQLPEQPDESAEASTEGAAVDMIVGLATSATWLMALIPLVLLIAAILFMRRRARPRGTNDEERESLGVAGSLAADLRDLLGKLRNPFAGRLHGLRAALAALQGDDPSSRVRRAYLRLLLKLEERDLVREPALTPGEFAESAGATIGAADAVQSLTVAYERARYQPTGANLADAESAEQALRTLDQRRSGGQG